MCWKVVVALLLFLPSFPSLPAAAQARSSSATLSTHAAIGDGLHEADDSTTQQLRTAGSSFLPSSEKVLKRTGIGALAGAALGAIFAGLQEVTVDHSNHEDGLIMLGASMLIGAVSGAVLGLVSAFF
jgi:hypothetical protein